MRRPVPAPRLLFAFVVVLFVACTSSDRAGARVAGVVTDTIGDTLVVRTVGAPDTATLRLVAELRIGELEGADEYAFGRVAAIAPAPGGGAYVWDAMARSIRQYDASGRFVRQVGRSGRGPGEYGSVAGLVAGPAYLAFWDKTTQQLSVYDSAGALQRHWAPAYPGAPMGELYPGPDGRLYLRHHVARPASDDPGSAAIAYVAFDPDGAPLGDTIPWRRPADPDGTSQQARGARGTMSLAVPHAPQGVVALSPAGYQVSGVGDRYALLLERRGAPPLRIERDVTPVPVSDAERDEERERISATMRTLDPGWSWSGAPVPSHRPYFSRVLFDARGRLWVERPVGGERISDEEHAATPRPPGPFGAMPQPRWRQSYAYDLFEPDGRYVGTLARPARASLLHMRGDTVWGVERDSLDVQYVVRWRLERARAARE